MVWGTVDWITTALFVMAAAAMSAVFFARVLRSPQKSDLKGVFWTYWTATVTISLGVWLLYVLITLVWSICLGGASVGGTWLVLALAAVVLVPYGLISSLVFGLARGKARTEGDEAR